MFLVSICSFDYALYASQHYKTVCSSAKGKHMSPQTQSTTTNTRFNRKALIILLAMVFLSTAGYGIMIPVAPFLIARYVSDPTEIGVTVGLLTTMYAVCQFLAAPGLGAISDRYGRRPILLLCLLGSAAGFLLLGIGGALGCSFWVG